MAKNIPQSNGKPNWFQPGGNVNLDDVNWYDSFKNTFGAGVAGSNFFRAKYAVDGAQKYIYVTFRAAYVQSLSDQHDLVFLGLRRKNGNKAIVIQIQVHGTPITPSGPPSANPPLAIVPADRVQYWTRLNTDAAWTGPVVPPNTWWIATNGHVWLQQKSAAMPPPPDNNNRWAVQLRIPANDLGDVSSDAGPNIDADFEMWYLMQGSTSTGSPVILADYRLTGNTTSGQIQNGTFDSPFASNIWEEFLLTAGPSAFGGVSIQGNGTNDIRVANTYGEGIKIAYGQANTFIARPRNYRPARINPNPPGEDLNEIKPGEINATFRIANWGSVGGDPNKVDWASGTWDYVPGNSALTPVPSGNYDPAVPGSPIPRLAQGANPDGTKRPIQLPNAVLTSPPGKSLSIHQCIYVTLSGTGLQFLNDSGFQNMDFDHTSLLEREAEINIRGLEPFSPQPRDVYLAIEKVNLPANTPPGTNEGKFLEATMSRLIQMGGPLAEKLQQVRGMLEEGGDLGSNTRLGELLQALYQSLSDLKYNNREQGLAALKELIAVLGRWLTAVKTNENAAKQLSLLFQALANWLLSTGLDSVAKLVAFISQLNQWLSALDNDPASSEMAPAVLRALRAWLNTLENGARLAGVIETIEGWFGSGRAPGSLPAILKALSDLLTSLSSGNANLRSIVGNFAEGVARWLKGYERLDAFVDAISQANLTEAEVDQLFPTFRVHTYHDTGERITGKDGKQHPVLREQSAFGLYAYHEGALEGWQTSIQGAQRIADDLYLLAVPNNGTAKIRTRIQAVEPGEERLPEDKIVPPGEVEPCGCLCQILRLFGIGKKK